MTSVFLRNFINPRRVKVLAQQVDGSTTKSKSGWTHPKKDDNYEVHTMDESN